MNLQFDIRWLDLLALIFMVLAAICVLHEKLQRDRVRQRLHSESAGYGAKSPFLSEAWESILSLLERARFVVPGNSKELEITLQRLSYAGFRDSRAPLLYYFIRFSAMVVLPITGLLIFSQMNLPQLKVVVFTVALAGFGLIFPSYVLDKWVAKHQLRLKNALPDALDLLVVCSEAGLGLNQALGRVGREIEEIHPELSAELNLVTAEILGGLEREAALYNMYERTGIDAVKSLVLVINQTLKLGTSIADTLRLYSDEYRETRMQAAEENAAKMSTKMIFPLVIFFLPCFFIVSVGPSAIKMLQAFAR
jgi:tight adherence protein C